MRTLQKNKQKMYYSLVLGEVEEYEYDEQGHKIPIYTDSEGIVHYQLTGEKITGYSLPTEFLANFSMSGGESEATSFGLDLSAYDAVITTTIGALPLTEGSVVWKKSTPEYNEDYAKASTADYKVVKVADTLNVTKYVLKAQVK